MLEKIVRNLSHENTNKIYTTITRRALVWASIISLLLSGAAYFYLENGTKLLCDSVLYTPAYSSCKDHFETPLRTALLFLCGVALAIPIHIVFSSKELRARFFTFLKYYAPTALLILCVGYFFPFCMGWLGCFSLFGPTVLFVGAIFAATIIAIAWTEHIVHRGRLIFIIGITIALLVSLHMAISFTDSYSKRDQYVGNHCEQISGQRERDHCFFTKGLNCDSIQSLDIKSECNAYVIRNDAVSRLDIGKCDTISIPDQVYICKKIINERLIQKI